MTLVGCLLSSPLGFFSFCRLTGNKICGFDQAVEPEAFKCCGPLRTDRSLIRARLNNTTEVSTKFVSKLN